MPTAELEHLLRAGAPTAPESLRARVREMRAPERRRPFFAVPRRAVLDVAAAVLVVAVGAAVVRGLVSSSSSPQPSVRAGAPPVSVVKQGALQKAPPYRAATTADSAVAGSGALAPSVSPGSRLQRYQASLRLRVDGEERLSGATSQATRVVRSLGGYAASIQYRTPAGRPGVAYLELRVPTVRVQDALARLSALGTILSQNVSVQDLERQLDRQTAQIAQLRETIRLTLAALRDPAITPVQRVQLQVKLASAKRALAQRTHARNSTVAEGTLARVSLELTAAKQAAAAPHEKSRIDRMLGSAASFLGLEAMIALYALIVVSPFLLLGALVWAGAWARRRRDERHLLTAP